MNGDRGGPRWYRSQALNRGGTEEGRGDDGEHEEEMREEHSPALGLDGCGIIHGGQLEDG